jgi:hypothetical protein
MDAANLLLKNLSRMLESAHVHGNRSGEAQRFSFRSLEQTGSAWRGR